LRAGASLKRHNAPEPITVLCLWGTGAFLAGSELAETHDMRARTLIALDAAIEHEVAAATNMNILVTRFK